ncbi:MAG: TM2 domain-containing protein [Endomicrobium sp.]|jgi:TM2 domain-containing membrane protein YozV|nr:TM2 domain-containing protein [Endomicrobium sp.]
MKSKIVAAVLAFFLGALGIDFFYLNDTKKGLIVLITFFVADLLCLVFVGFFILGALGIWALVRTVLYLISSDENFEKKYVVKPVAK